MYNIYGSSLIIIILSYNHAFVVNCHAIKKTNLVKEKMNHMRGCLLYKSQNQQVT